MFSRHDRFERRRKSRRNSFTHVKAFFVHLLHLFHTSNTPLSHLYHIRHTSSTSGKSRQDFPDAPRNPLVRGTFSSDLYEDVPALSSEKSRRKISAASPGQKACAYGSFGRTVLPVPDAGRRKSRRDFARRVRMRVPGPVRPRRNKRKGRSLPGPAPSSLPLRFLISPPLSSGIPPARRG